jgi:hypothetical protein
MSFFHLPGALYFIARDAVDRSRGFVQDPLFWTKVGHSFSDPVLPPLSVALGVAFNAYLYDTACTSLGLRFPEPPAGRFKRRLFDWTLPRPHKQPRGGLFASFTAPLRRPTEALVTLGTTVTLPVRAAFGQSVPPPALVSQAHWAQLAQELRPDPAAFFELGSRPGHARPMRRHLLPRRVLVPSARAGGLLPSRVMAAYWTAKPWLPAFVALTNSPASIPKLTPADFRMVGPRDLRGSRLAAHAGTCAADVMCVRRQLALDLSRMIDLK